VERAEAKRAHRDRGALTALRPPLAAEWLEAAERMIALSERQLLVHAAPPETVSADTLIRELALTKESLTFDRRVREMLTSGQDVAILSQPTVLGAEACAALTRAVDEGASLRHGGTDGMPEHTLHLDRTRLEALIGRDAADALWALPVRYRRQAAAARAAASADGADAADGANTEADGHAHAEADGGETRIVEIFIRRFSAATRPWIKMHADVAAVTVNVALTSEQDSPGGSLLTVYDGAVRAVDRRAGDATVHPSSLLHGVSRMHEGERYTLILFFE